jgi:hypothetical protein
MANSKSSQGTSRHFRSLRESEKFYGRAEYIYAPFDADVVTLSPSPSSRLSTTEAPSPTSRLSTTLAPSPTVRLDTTLQPTPTSFTSNPTASPSIGGGGSSRSSKYWPFNEWQTYIIAASLLVILIGLVGLFYFIRYYYLSNNSESAKASESEEVVSPIVGAAESTALLGPIQKLNALLGKNGKIVQINTPRGLIQVKLSLFNNKEIRWELTNNIMMNKKYKLELSEVLYVQPGKQTKNFQNVRVEDNLCLSLIFQSVTLDIVAPTKEERDIMVKGFNELADSLKERSQQT